MLYFYNVSYSIFSNFGRGKLMIAKCTFSISFNQSISQNHLRFLRLFFIEVFVDVAQFISIVYICTLHEIRVNTKRYVVRLFIEATFFVKKQKVSAKEWYVLTNVLLIRSLNLCTFCAFNDYTCNHRKLIAFTRNINLTNFVKFAEHFSLSAIYYPRYYFRYKLVWKDLFMLWILVEMPMFDIVHNFLTACVCMYRGLRDTEKIHY